jgi:shikimate dehydrogenase
MADHLNDGIQRVGLLGWPVSHSVSPAMHNAAFESLGLNWKYGLLPVQSKELLDEMGKLVDGGYRGFNVTIPHKRMVLDSPLISEVDPVVGEIGAANTLTLLDDGNLRASNTDWQGFAYDLNAHNITVQNKMCIVLGTGGSSKSVGYALRQMGAKEITNITRQPNGQSKVIGYDNLHEKTVTEEIVIVNCTPVGMHPDIDSSPWPDDLAFPKESVVVDLIYNPPITRLVERARSAGVKTIGGLGMLVRQGALSFEQWTGIAPPLEVMEHAAKQALGVPVSE